MCGPLRNQGPDSTVPGSQFTCFTATKVQILTLRKLQDLMTEVTRFGKDTKKQQKPGTQSTCFTGTKVPILTPEALRARLPQQVEAPPKGDRLPHAIYLLYMCPHTAVGVSSYCYTCVLILLYMCPHTAICVLTAIHVSSYCYVCVLILLCMYPHAAICVSSCCYICVLILLCMFPHTACMCPHTAVYVS